MHRMIDAGAQTSLAVEEKLVLQELMNISFGDAGAELEEVLGINVQLSIPEADMVPETALADYFLDHRCRNYSFLAVEQRFWGSLSGTALMCIPERCGTALVSGLRWYDSERHESSSIEMLEQGAILEVGNILTGVCVGKIAELLDTVVTYSPPRLWNGDEFAVDCRRNSSYSKVSVVLQTCFRFVRKEVEGRICIATDDRSLDWIKGAISGYVELIT